MPEIEPFDQTVKLLGPRQAGQKRDVFALSIPQADSIFGALHDKYRHIPEVKMVVVIQDWADMTGCWEADHACAIASNDTEMLIEWLFALRAEDFDGDYPPPAGLLCCAQAMQSCLHQNWVKGEPIYIENI